MGEQEIAKNIFFALRATAMDGGLEQSYMDVQSNRSISTTNDFDFDNVQYSTEKPTMAGILDQKTLSSLSHKILLF